jgi:hypothetical protein
MCFITTRLVPHNKLSMYIMKTEHLILYGEIFAVCSAVHAKHINTARGKTVEIVTAILTDIFLILSLCYS